MAIDVTAPQARERLERLERIWAEAPGLVGWLTTVNHKRIGQRYFVTSLAFFVAGGIEALLMRTQLAQPDAGVLSPSAYNQVMTMHGVTMIFFFVVPMLTGAFGNYLVPLMIGARDMAFPRMNAFSYWVYLASGIFVYVGLAIGDAPNAGWFAYVPLAAKPYNPGHGSDFYELGLIFLTISTTVGAANFIVTIFKLRAPGMSLNRLPLFVWAILATSFSQIFALPALTASNLFSELDRKIGTHFFDVSKGGDTILYQHLFWIFGHPDVYIIFLPAVGIVGMVVPIFARRPMVAQNWLALATVVTAFIGFGVWVHHMFATGLPQVTLVFYAAASLVIVIPSGIQIFGWAATLLTGRPWLRTPLLYVLGFFVVFTIGGLSGVTFAAIQFDQQVTDTYYVVAHFHYVLFGAVFPFFAGMHLWYPKVTGRMYGERLAQAAFWLFFVGFNLTFFPMHIAGLLGMPRRIYTYHSELGWGDYNLAETIGAYMLASSILLVLVNFAASRAIGPRAGPNPWGGDTLEWTVSSPPPEFNYPVIPTVRSAHPAWDLEERAEDRARLERGELTLERGHETPATTVLEADLDEVLEMPGESAWPLVLTLALSVSFPLFLTSHFAAAAIFVGAAGLALVGWHVRETPDGVRPRVSRPNGWWGMAMLVATEAALFGTLIASYFYLRFKSVDWPPHGIPGPEVGIPILLTAVLVATSLPMHLAQASARRGRLRATRAWLSLALLVGSGYLAMQIDRLAESLGRFTPEQHAYGSIYYALLGAHHAHVAVGLLLVGWLLVKLSRGLTNYRLVGIESTAFYWHFVNVLAVAVTATLLSAA